MDTNQELFEFKFYEWEKQLKDKPYLKQPFGDKWEEYTWGEVGDLIGLIGQTGRVTGPHLHWEVYLMGVAINPEIFLNGSI